MSSPKRLASLGVAALLTLASCQHDTAVLYRSPVDDRDAAATSAAGLPSLPVRPDAERVEACTTCAAAGCSSKRADCLEDDDCIAMLRCKGACQEPACLERCDAKHTDSPWYDDLSDCVFGNCSNECGRGQNWACARDYDWPQPASTHLEVRFEFGDITAVGQERTYVSAAGASARSCSLAIADSRACGMVDAAPVGADNTVTLQVATPLTSGSTKDSYLEVSSADVGPRDLRDLFYFGPVVQPTRVGVGLLPRSFTFLWMGQAYQDGAASVVTYALDCTRQVAVGVRYELLDSPASAIEQCDATAQCGGSITAGTLARAQLVAADLAGSPSVRAVDAATNAVVAQSFVGARTGWTTTIVLYPLTRAAAR